LLGGLAFGSFLNVCISRIPRDESVVAPASHCRACGVPIRWRDNIPLVSWLALGGRCRHCAVRISVRYPAVELLTALLFPACYLSFGWSWLTLKACVFGFLLIGLVFMDAETGLLPREFTYPGILLGLAFSWFAPTDYAATEFLLRLYDRRVPNLHWLSLLDSALGGLVGAGFFFSAWALYYVVRKKHGLGFGDIALMAMSGAFLGVKCVALVIFCAPLLGLLFAVLLLLWERFASRPKSPTVAHGAKPFLSRQIPFGVFLGACSLAAVFLGQVAWTWYLRQI
jgi:leader peptidase (prepilin peptidase)/N-methyltransferase